MLTPIALVVIVVLVGLGVIAASMFWVQWEAVELVVGWVDLALPWQRVCILDYTSLGDLLPFDRRRL